MTTKLTGFTVGQRYADYVQLGNSGLGVNSSLSTVYDGLGKALPYQISSTAFNFTVNPTFNGSGLGTTSGGTGLSSATAYSVICGGTTSTGAFQSVASLGSSGQVLTSNGASTLPTWQSLPASTVPNGGTGNTSFLAYGPICGGTTSTGALQSLGGMGTSGQALLSNGSSALPGFGNLGVPAGGTGLTSSSIVPYAVLCGGNNTSAALNQVSGLGSSGQVLTSNGASALPTWQAGGALSIAVQKFVAGAGTYTYTPTSGMLYCIVEGIGNGGPGGSAAGVSSTSSGVGGGGGGGGYVRKLYTAANIGASATVVIGSLGSAGAAGNNAGTDSADCTFTPAGTGSVLTAGHGVKGNAGPAVSTTTTTTGGAGGTGTNGDINISGQAGHSGFVRNGSAGTMDGMDGGNSQFGFGGIQTQGTTNGPAGTGYGAGGAGAAAAGANGAGGAPTTGIFIVTEFI